MALIKAKANQSSVTRVANAEDAYIRAFRDGSITPDQFVAGLSLEGKVFTANAGTITTPITFGAGSIDGTEFDLHVAVPADKVIIPLALEIKMEAYGTSAIFECMANYGKGSVVGAGTTVTPACSKTNGNASACTVTAAATVASATAMATNVVEFFRDGLQLAATTGTGDSESNRTGETFRWSWKTDGVLRQIGPSAQLGVFAAAQAGTGFITLTYAELDSSDM